MTWSIVARDPASGALGVAVASKFFAVGALVPWVRSGVGAVATQAMVNPMFGPHALQLLADGTDAEQALRWLIANDAGSAARQLHLVAADGRSAAFTGGECVDWCGHQAGTGASVAGNMLAGPDVLDATLAGYADGAALPFAERLLHALIAGDAAGGDKRGRQSAALLVHAGEDYPALSLRVDDHPDSLAELDRLYAVSRRDFAVYEQFLPTRANPAGITDRARLEAARRAAAEDEGADG